MKVAIYSRISTDNLGQDIDRQINECRKYCDIMGYEIVEEYLDEGFARTTRNRPALDTLIKDANHDIFVNTFNYIKIFHGFLLQLV